MKRFEKNPEEIAKLFGGVGVEKSEKVEREKDELEKGSDGFEESDGLEDEEMDELEDEDEDGLEEEDEDNEEDEDEEEDDEDKEEKKGVEDKFLKIKELEYYLQDDEAREYGLKKKKGTGKVSKHDEEEEEEEEDDDENEDDEEDDDDDDDEVIFWIPKNLFFG